jgi:hypothetical protein
MPFVVSFEATSHGANDIMHGPIEKIPKREPA